MMHRFVLLAALLVTQCASAAKSNNVRAASSNVSSHQQQQHRELGVSDWWYTILNSLHVSCPHDSTDDHPTGHCAHPSHHAPKPSGSHKSSSHSSGCTDDCTDNDNGEGCGCGDDTTEEVWADDGHTDDTTEEVWADDGHTDDTTEAVTWADDGHTDDTTDDNTAAVTWGNDGYTAETTDDTTTDDAWEDDGHTDDNGSSYSFAKSSLNYRTQSNGANGGGSGSGKKWAIGAGVVGLVGVGALVASKKRKHSEVEDNNVPENVYIQDTGDNAIRHAPLADPANNNASLADGMDNESAGAEIEMQSVGEATTMSRAQSFKSSISKRSLSFKNRFGRSRSIQNGEGDAGEYQAPNASDGEAVV